jgi:hypothetical protein|tara:strand:- start:60071 stop:62209 length:2139 start_codon:yes stop_codon:yes gene_type:complete
MSKVKLNKISVKQQGGQMIPSQPAMSNQQPVVDPMVQQVTEMISSSVNQGQDIVDVVLDLSQQQVDQQVIAQALMMGGMQQEDIMTLFQQVSVKAQPPGPSSPEEVNSSPQLLARNEALENSAPEQDTMPGFAKSGIEIKPENRGKFTAWAKKRGMSVSEAAKMVMANKDNYPPSVVKMANFAKNAAGWKKQDGGEADFKPHMMYKGDDGVMARTYDQHIELGEKGYIHLAQDGGGMNYTEGMRQREGSYNPPNRKYTLDPRFRDYGGEPRSFMEWYGSKQEGDEIGKFIDNPTQFYKPTANSSYNMADFLQNINPDGNILLEGLNLASNINQELFSKEKGENDLNKGALSGFKDKRAYAKAASPLYYGTKTTYDLSDENLMNIETYKTMKLEEEEQKQKELKANYDKNVGESMGVVPELMSQESYFKSIGVDPDNKMMGSDFNQRLYDQYLDSYNKTYPKGQDGLETENEFTINFDEPNYTVSDVEGLQQLDPVILYGSDNTRLERADGPEETSADYYSRINMPETERVNSLTGKLTELGDNPFFRAGTSLSKAAVDTASFLNDNIFNRVNQEKAKEDRQDMFMADNWASIVTDAPGSKGNYKTNTGMLRSTKDRVVGLDEATFNPFMTTQFMRTGGEESYLANRDRVIKAAIAEQDKAKQGGEPNNEGFRALPDFVQDKIMKRQQGGETVNLSQDMIAELIAAGADIEIL